MSPPSTPIENSRDMLLEDIARFVQPLSIGIRISTVVNNCNLHIIFLAFVSSAYSVWSLERLYIPNSAVILLVVGVLVLLLGLIAEQIAMLQITAHSQRK